MTQSLKSPRLREIAIYDLDRTITRLGTYTPFLLFAASCHHPWRLLLLPLYFAAMAGYPFGLVGRKAIKQWGFRLLLGHAIDAATLRGLARRFAHWVANGPVYADALQRIRADRRAGRTLVLATASPDYYAEPLGTLLGFDAVIATRQTQAGARTTAVIAGENCYGRAKLARIQHWLDAPGAGRDTQHILFYSDHASDEPALRWADSAYVVNPSRKLARLARTEGWRELRFR